MSLLAGWVKTSITNKNAERLLADIVNQAPQYIRQNIIIDCTDDYALAAGTDKIYREQGCLLVNVGLQVFENSEQVHIQNYRVKGNDFLDGSDGRSSFILIDIEQKKVILATDAIGQVNIYYAQTDSGLVFGSSADMVISHPEVKADISPQSVYDYVYFHHCPSPNTIYQQVKKLEDGQVLIYEDGNITLKHYWQPQFHEQMDCSIHEAGKQLQDKLIAAVRRLADTAEDTGAFLSGGLDSSSVAGALAQVYPDQAKTFSMGFRVDGYDEMEYARIAVKRFNTRQHEYYVTPDDTVTAISQIAAYYDEPFGNSSALAAYYCAKMAKENGIKVLLGGDGGDELFAGNERYAKQLLFDYYHQLPKILSAGMDSALNHLPTALANNKLVHKAKRYIEQAKTPMPDRMQDYNFLHRHDNAEIFQPDFLQSIDSTAPIHLLRESYHRPEHASTLNRMLYMDWKTTLHDNDLVKVNKMCEMAGVQVRYPLLDKEIVDLSIRIPSNLKLKGQKLRWFYKQAFSDLLPEQIINKSKHGFGLPFGIWLKDYQPLKELAYDSIDSLKNRPYFNSEFLDHAVKMHQSIHAAYYGELIWVLMMLELWFQGKKR